MFFHHFILTFNTDSFQIIHYRLPATHATSLPQLNTKFYNNLIIIANIYIEILHKY